MGQVDIWSDVPPDRDILWPSVILLLVRLTCWSDPQVRLTFSQTYSPRQRHLVAKCDTIWVRLTVCQICWSGWHLVRWTPNNWNAYTLNPLSRMYWRANLVPAATVIPAPLAYIKVVAVKKFIVETLGQVDIW